MKRNIEHVGRHMALKASFINEQARNKGRAAILGYHHFHELLGMGMALRSMGINVIYDWDGAGLIAAIIVDGLRFAAE